MTQRLFLLAYNAIFTARVNQAAFSYPLMEVDYDTVGLGPYTEIKAGMTVLFGSSAGDDDLGRQRVKSADATTLYIGRSSNGSRDGEVDLTDNAYITVVEDFRPWSKIPYITDDGTVYKDGNLTFSDQTDDIPPVAHGGYGMAGTISGGALEVDFDSAGSYSPCGASISSVLWDVGDGTITTGTAASSAITAVFSAGFRYVDLTVTDSNGKTHTTHIPVYARDPAADTSIGKFVIERHTISKDGQQMSFRILEDIAETTYLDGCLVMLWEGEPADGSDRSHMKFIGWHHTDPAAIRAERTGIVRDTTLECLDIAGKLKTLPGFPVVVENADTPANWLKMSSASMAKYIDYLLRWHSTALEIAPVTLTTLVNYEFVILGSDGGSLWEQAARRAQSLVPDYVLTCNTKGGIFLKPDPFLQATGDRTATVQVALTEADWSDIRYTHQRPPRVHWLRSEAVLASSGTVAALFCVAPDNTPGQGTSEQTHGEQLARTQADLNVCEGHRYARLNATETFFTVTLAEGDTQDIEPAAMTWVTLVISAANAAQRGLTLSTARGLVHQIDVRYQYGRSGLTRTVNLTWEKETTGLPAITFVPPPADIAPPYDPPPDVIDPNPDTEGDGFGTCYVMDANYLIRTRDLSNPDPAWADIAPTAATHNDFILDSWAPTTTAYLITNDGLWKATDMDQASPSFSLVLTAATAETALSASSSSNWLRVFTSINVQDYVIILFTAVVGGTTGLYCGYSDDGGSTWNYSLVYNSLTFEWNGAADYVPHLVGGNIRIYTALHHGGPGSDAFCFRSDDGGANWSSVGTIRDVGTGQSPHQLVMHCPYDGNTSGNIVYAAAHGNSGGQGLFYSNDSGANWSEINTLAVQQVRRYGMETYTENNQSAYYFYYTGVGGTIYLVTTSNGFSSTTARDLTGLTGSTLLASGGFPYKNNQFYAVTASGVFVSIDGGDNWFDRTGDWASGFSGQAVIVPVWVAED